MNYILLTFLDFFASASLSSDLSPRPARSGLFLLILSPAGGSLDAEFLVLLASFFEDYLLSLPLLSLAKLELLPPGWLLLKGLCEVLFLLRDLFL